MAMRLPQRHKMKGVKKGGWRREGDAELSRPAKMRVSPFLWVLGSCLATLLRHDLQKATILRFILSYIPVRNCLIPSVKPLKTTNCEESEMAIGNIGNDVIQTFGTAAQPIRNEHPPMRDNVMEFRRGPLMISLSMSSFYDEINRRLSE